VRPVGGGGVVDEGVLRTASSAKQTGKRFAKQHQDTAGPGGGVAVLDEHVRLLPLVTLRVHAGGCKQRVAFIRLQQLLRGVRRS
jgi:hypothetical protein